MLDKKIGSMWFEQRPPRFECQACGQCCLGDDGDYVALVDGEEQVLSDHLGLSVDLLRRRYLVRLGPERWGIRIRPDTRCLFLDGDGHCAIYPVRPMQCRSYPYWPEIMISERRFEDERQRCRGIGCGPAIAPQRVRDWLAKDPGSLD